MLKIKNLTRILYSKLFSSEGILEAPSKEVKSIVFIGTISLLNERLSSRKTY
jgi:hypothetical protein